MSPLKGRDSIEADRKRVLGIPNGIYMKLMIDEVRSAFENQLATLIGLVSIENGMAKRSDKLSDREGLSTTKS
ncbi:hypothetical protein [Paenibacillus sp. NPDC058071]|uniref:hypothetical protein n=1 Tax=Paenibacillus sp. NPDC058071 TaxID=3346326 RepID=UPI0036D9E3DF